MATYVVGDIHGCFSQWIQLKNRIENEDSDAVFILVGDIVDRGGEVVEMVRWAMENISVDGKYQMILGNHEAEKIEWFQDNAILSRFLSMKGYRLYSQDKYNFKDSLLKKEVPYEELVSMIEWFKQLPAYKDITIAKKHFMIVHAYYPPQCRNRSETFKKTSIYPDFRGMRSDFDLKKQNLRQIVWTRNYKGYPDLKNTTVIHGHTPTITDGMRAMGRKAGKIYYGINEINIDCGCVFKKLYGQANLAAIRLPDLKEYYLIEENEMA